MFRSAPRHLAPLAVVALSGASFLASGSAAHAAPGGDCTTIDANSASYFLGYFIANATPTTFVPGGATAGTYCQIDDKLIGFTQADIDSIAALADPSGGQENASDLLIFSFDPMSKQYDITFDFTADAPPADLVGSGTATYQFIVAEPGFTGGNTFNSFSDSFVTGTGGGGSNVASVSPDPNVVAGTTSLTVSNTYTAGLASFSNTYTQAVPTAQVPAPLPLLGVGAAFATSRQLRRRLRSNV